MTIDKIRTSDGQEHAVNYNALENKPGYGLTSSSIVTGVSLARNEVLEVDLSKYLPKDDHVYCVCLQIRVSTSIASAVYVGSDLLNEWSVCAWRGIPASEYIGGSAIILVGPGRLAKIITPNPITLTELSVSYYFRVS